MIQSLDCKTQLTHRLYIKHKINNMHELVKYIFKLLTFWKYFPIVNLLLKMEIIENLYFDY